MPVSLYITLPLPNCLILMLIGYAFETSLTICIPELTVGSALADLLAKRSPTAPTPAIPKAIGKKFLLLHFLLSLSQEQFAFSQPPLE